MNKIKLYQLENSLKRFIAMFVIVLTIGVSIGLYYLYYTTSYSKSKIEQRYGETKKVIEEDFGIKENGGKSFSEILMTVHNHIIGFSIFFFIIGILFYFNSVISGNLKNIILFEPMFSIAISFGSILGMKLVSNYLIYLVIVSASLMYFSFYFMVSIILYELLFKENS